MTVQSYLLRKLNYLVNGLLVEGRIGYHASLANQVLREFELWFDQGEYRHIRKKEVDQWRQQGGDGDKRNIHNRKIKMAVMDILCGNVLCVESLQYHNSRILPYFPGELPVGNINGIDYSGTMLKKAIGEAAGGSPDIDTNLILDSEMEVREPLGQLQAPP